MFLSQIRYRQFVVTNSWLQTLLQSGSLFHQVPSSFGRLERSCFVFQKFHSILEPEITWLMLLISEFWKHLISKLHLEIPEIPKPEILSPQASRSRSSAAAWVAWKLQKFCFPWIFVILDLYPHRKKQQKSKMQLDLPNEPVNDILKAYRNSHALLVQCIIVTRLSLRLVPLKIPTRSFSQFSCSIFCQCSWHHLESGESCEHVVIRHEISAPLKTSMMSWSQGPEITEKGVQIKRWIGESWRPEKQNP